MKERTILLSGILAASTLLSATQGAHAQIVDDVIVIDPPIILELFDEKVMPGSGCQAYIGSQASDFNHYQPYLHNTSSGDRAVTCPIVRDNTTNATGTWSAAVTGNNPGGNVFCQLSSYDQFGGFLDLGAASTNAVGIFTLNLDSAASPLSISANDSFYSLYCSLPAGAYLYSYRWAERLRTDRNN